MKTTTKAFKYLKAADLNARWNLLSKPRKRYARYLVERYGWTATMAVQQSFIFGFDGWPYDYRRGRCIQEERTAKSFGFR